MNQPSGPTIRAVVNKRGELVLRVPLDPQPEYEPNTARLAYWLELPLRPDAGRKRT